jgi:hypothetical protein
VTFIDTYYEDIDFIKKVLPMISNENYPNINDLAENLVTFSYYKCPSKIQNISSTMQFLLSICLNININENFIYQGNNHSISDFLMYYGWNYPNSPMMNIFTNYCHEKNINLPKIINLIFFDDNFPCYGYDIILRKYQYTKDPMIYEDILEELNKHKIEYPKEKFSCSTIWHYIPGLPELFNISISE